MNTDFSLILVLLSFGTGAIWLVDSLVLARQRRNRVKHFLSERNVPYEDFLAYQADPDGKMRARNPGEADTGTEPVRNETLEQARVLCRLPAPVDYARSLFPVLLAVLIVRSFLFEPFQIPSESMVPTLNVGDFIVVNKFAYGLRLPVTGTKILDIGEPKRGDVMVFIPPHDPRYYIKRVIGLPGDHVRYANGIVYVNHEPLVQSDAVTLPQQRVKLSLETIDGLRHQIYSDVPSRPDGDFVWLDSTGARREGWMTSEGMVVPEGQYFMLGDNRDHSEDSRYWGPASGTRIVGKAVAVWMHKESGWHLPVFGKNRLIENAE